MRTYMPATVTDEVLLTSKCRVMCMFAMFSAIDSTLFRRDLKHFVELMLLNGEVFRKLIQVVWYLP